MNIVRKNLDAVNAIISIELTPEDYNADLLKSLKDARKRGDFKGFRPGMAPMSLVKKMYRKGLLVDLLDRKVGEAFNNYIKENNLNILGEPMPNESEETPEMDFDTEDGTYTFVFDIALAPEMKVSLTKRDKVPYYSIKIEDSIVEQQLNAYAQQHGEQKEVETIEENDIVYGNVREMKDGAIDEQGLMVENVTLMAAYLKDEEQKALFIGKKKGEKFAFNAAKAFGNDNELARFLRVNKEEAGVYTNDFEFEVTSALRHTPAEINQALFDKVFGEGNVKSVEEFKNKIIEETIKPAYTKDADYRFAIDAEKHFVAKFDDKLFPADFLKRWVRTTNNEITEEALERDFPTMLEGLKWQLIKDQIAKDNDIKVEEEDLKAEAYEVARMRFAQYGIPNVPEEMAKQYGDKMLEEKKPEDIRNFYEHAFENKVIKVIREKVALDNKEISMEDFEKLFAPEA